MYPLPNIQNLSNSLHDCNIFLKIYLVKGYHQIPATAADIPKMAIIIPFGLLEYLFMPFKWSNTAQTFQCMMDRTVDGLEGVFAYLDDSSVSFPDRQTHLPTLEPFFNALVANGLAINPEKCVFAVPTLTILGHTISVTGSAPMASYAATIKSWPPPGHQPTAAFSRLIKLLLSFLAKLCTVLRPLIDLLNAASKTLEWTATEQEALQHAKRLLAAPVSLQHPSPQAELSHATDAYDTHIGSIMQQKLGDYWKLCPTEKREGAWSLREMGSTRRGGMGEGPAPQAESKISS